MMGDDVLLYWAFENLVKNSIETIQQKFNKNPNFEKKISIEI